MKGLADDASCSVALLDGAVALGDVVENHIYEQTMVRLSLRKPSAVTTTSRADLV